MRFLDVLRLAAGGLNARRMRTVLTVTGILIGTAAIVGLVSSSQGWSASIGDELDALGPTTILVIAAGSEDAGFSEQDVRRIEQIEGVDQVVPTIGGAARVSRGGIQHDVTVIGIDPQRVPEVYKGYAIAQGRSMSSNDLTRIVLGDRVADPPDEPRRLAGVGDLVRLEVAPRGLIALPGEPQAQPVQRSFLVAGVAAPFGSAPFADIDNTAFLTLRAAQQLFDRDKPNQLIVQAVDVDSVEAVQDRLDEAYEDAIVVSSLQITRTVQNIFGQVTALLGGIAAISLIVAGVGIANTMYVSVLERTTEIGLLKALGFQARSVLGVFLVESGLTGALGGVLGVAVGAGLGAGLMALLSPERFGPQEGERFQGPGGEAGFTGIEASPVLSLELVVAVVLFAVLVSVLAGLLPALRAARLDPVKALRRL